VLLVILSSRRSRSVPHSRTFGSLNAASEHGLFVTPPIPPLLASEFTAFPPRGLTYLWFRTSGKVTSPELRSVQSQQWP